MAHEGIIVRKDGSSSIEHEAPGIGINPLAVRRIVVEHVNLRNDGYHTAEVSSGAVVEGIRMVIAMGRDPKEFTSKVLAMIGMPNHFAIWNAEAMEQGMLVPASLSTDIELKDKKEGKEIKGGMGEAIADKGLLLVGNFHDEASSKEMKIFDRLWQLRKLRRGQILKNESEENDFHAANIAKAVGARYLMLCTAADGYYDEDGTKRDIITVKEIKQIKAKQKKQRKQTDNNIYTKLFAAAEAAEEGIEVVIGNTLEDSRRLIEDKKVGTWVVQ
jgi:glutamate 5-kinase